jgi:hypothetical protein
MIERIETGQRINQIVKHTGVAYLCGQEGDGATVAGQTRHDPEDRHPNLRMRPIPREDWRVSALGHGDKTQQKNGALDTTGTQASCACIRREADAGDRPA